MTDENLQLKNQISANTTCPATSVGESEVPSGTAGISDEGLVGCKDKPEVEMSSIGSGDATTELTTTGCDAQVLDTASTGNDLMALCIMSNNRLPLEIDDVVLKLTVFTTL